MDIVVQNSENGSANQAKFPVDSVMLTKSSRWFVVGSKGG
jgi:hypothetical protein